MMTDNADPSAFDTLMTALDEMPGDPATLDRVRRLILSMGGESIYIKGRALRVRERALMARKLLAQGMRRNDVRDALIGRLACSRSVAYKAIKAALKDRPCEGSGKGQGFA